ncbi:MAG: prepilin peptidase [Clostridia bacterium]|nr:prepilin peptidase [Clostridia bacterium]
MYFNDVHILFYVLFGLVGAIIGQFVHYSSKCFLSEKKILSKESYKDYKKNNQPSFVFIIINAIAYIILLYKFGLHTTFIENINLMKYIILIPMLLCVVVVDYKIQIIPNRLNLLMFNIGLIFTFLLGLTNLTIAKDMLLGMITGAGIFLIITLLGGLIAGKEAMGLGDVKLMGALGLYFGFANILIITVLSFLVGAIGSIIFLIIKKINKKKNSKLEDGYIPFGPFIVCGSIISMFVPFNTLFTILMKIFSLGLY